MAVDTSQFKNGVKIELGGQLVANTVLRFVCFPAHKPTGLQVIMN